MSKNKKYFPTEDELRIVQKYYDGHTLSINKIVRLLGQKYPRWHIKRLGNEMGLARGKSPDWSEKEVEALHKWYPRVSFAVLARKLRGINGGIYRSPTAILLKAKREAINKRSDGFTMRMIEILMGSDHHKIEKWVQNGWLVDGHKGTSRTILQGGDMHHFTAKDLRTFVINHPDEVDLRRVERISFIHLIAGLL